MTTTDTAKIDFVVRTFLSKCACKPQYIMGKPNPEYYRMRKYILNNQHRFPLQACYEYAQSLKKTERMTFEEFVKMALAHGEWRRSELEREKAKEMLANVEIPKQRRFTYEDLMKL